MTKQLFTQAKNHSVGQQALLKFVIYVLPVSGQRSFTVTQNSKLLRQLGQSDAEFMTLLFQEVLSV